MPNDIDQCELAILSDYMTVNGALSESMLGNALCLTLSLNEHCGNELTCHCQTAADFGSFIAK